MNPVVLIPTYARVHFLRQQLACLMAQEYPCQVIVLNDCPWQTLHYRSTFHCRSCIRIINTTKPFPTLGHKRNELLKLAGDRFAIWADDDDWCLPWYVQTLVHSARFSKWAVCPMSFFVGKGEWSYAPWNLGCAGPANEWLKEGGAGLMDCGEDAQLRCIAAKHVTNETIPGYVYRWGQGSYHVSGRGDPFGGKHYREDAEKRKARWEEPRGFVNLHPLPSTDWSGAQKTVQEILNHARNPHTSR